MNKNNKEEQVEEKKTDEKEQPQAQPQMRQIIIETDGNNIQIIKAEVGGRIELIGVLQSLITYFNQQK